MSDVLYWLLVTVIVLALLATLPLVLPFLVATAFLTRLEMFVRSRSTR